MAELEAFIVCLLDSLGCKIKRNEVLYSCPVHGADAQVFMSLYWAPSLFPLSSYLVAHIFSSPEPKAHR